MPVEEEDKEYVDEEEEDPYKEDVDGVVPSLALMNDLYSGITKPKKSTQNFNRFVAVISIFIQLTLIHELQRHERI